MPIIFYQKIIFYWYILINFRCFHEIGVCRDMQFIIVFTDTSEFCLYGGEQIELSYSWDLYVQCLYTCFRWIASQFLKFWVFEIVINANDSTNNFAMSDICTAAVTTSSVKKNKIEPGMARPIEKYYTRPKKPQKDFAPSPSNLNKGKDYPSFIQSYWSKK